MKSLAILCGIFLAGVDAFFFDSMNSMRCQPINMFCHLSCANGFEKDGSGCDICHCKGVDTHLVSVDGTHHHIRDPCIPSQQSCPLNCEYYVKGGNGCEFCMCDTSHHTTKAPSTAQPTSTVQKIVTSTTAAPPAVTSGNSNVTTHDPIDCEVSKQVCNLRCKGDYLVDPKDCTVCVCKSDVC
uniref:Antistasin-like n=1 Tax=Crassostrea virginica TaxID=6565 RepID=A0A8B8C3L7_CRAVI|nr:antistasin-like [Crassostrea virginica]